MTRFTCSSGWGALFISAALLVASPADAQSTEALHVDQAFSLTAELAPRGGVDLDWVIADGYYLYRDRIELTTTDGSSVPLETQKGKPKDDPYFGRLEIYHDEATAAIAPSDLADFPIDARLQLTYQGCQDGGICYAPETKTIDVAALASGSLTFGETTSSPSAWLSSLGQSPTRPSARSRPADGRTVSNHTTGSPSSEATTVISNLPGGDKTALAAVPEASAGPAGGVTMDPSAGGLVAGFLAEGGAVFAIGAFFVLGLGLAFTPCVLPMYPILAGQLGRMGSERSIGRGALHSGAYVLSMASALGLLGIVAAWSGQNLQMMLQSPLAIGVVSALFLLLALSMFGAYSIRLPAAWVSAIGRAMPGGRGSLATSAGLGFLSALIVGPCVTAPLAGALLYIGQSGDVALGASALFALGLGQGVPLIVFGTLGSNVMPKAGPWMEIVTKAFGFAFLGMAIWMASRILEPWVTVGLWGVLALALAVALGTLSARGPKTSFGYPVGRLASLIAMILGGTLLVGAAAGADDPLRPLEPLTAGRDVLAAADAPLEFASVSGPRDLARRMSSADKPKLLYFTAEWCVSCKVIEREVFENETVRAELADVDLMKVDVTDATPEHDLLMKQLSVVGPPTMLFIERSGTEAPGTRAVGELSAADFLSRAEAI